MVVLIRWEAAADGALIYLCSADDTADRQCLSAPPASLFLSLMLPRKGQPFPPERRNCGHTFQGVLQFRLPSAPQRYNTLDFPRESRVPTGMLLTPIGNPEPKELFPSGHPAIFSQMMLTQKSCVFSCPTIFRKCHNTYSLSLQSSCKNREYVL